MAAERYLRALILDKLGPGSEHYVSGDRTAAK